MRDSIRKEESKSKESKGNKPAKQSVWETVIAEVSKTTNTAESHLIFLGQLAYLIWLGNKNSGKRSILSSLSQRLTKSEMSKSINSR